MNTIEKICRHCKSHFHASMKEHTRGNANFCSRSCSTSFNNHDKKQKRSHNNICAMCGTTFYRAISKKLNSKSGLYFCSRLCKDLAQRSDGLEGFNPYSYTNGKTAYRDRAFKEFVHSCSVCGYDEYKNVLVVHHKDYDRNNNNMDNLQILCPTCHAVIHYTSKTGRWSTRDSNSAEHSPCKREDHP